MSKRANKSLKRLQRKRAVKASRLEKESIDYAIDHVLAVSEGRAVSKGPRKDSQGETIPWMAAAKEMAKRILQSQATKKLRCSSANGEHRWELSRGKTFYRCSACRISTYNHNQAQAAA